VLTSRKMGRQWQLAHEQMMMKFVDLCVEFREARKCKEGLYFYRNLSVQQAVQSLEKVVVHLIESSMRKTAEARARTESAKQLDNLEDLESEDPSPESLLMAGVTTEGSRDRAERETIVPWVRHMWDTYRNVLETLRNNPVLENLYHNVAMRSMNFCKIYSRNGEFRKLCNALRGHWKAQKENALQPNGRVITHESVEKGLGTRFVQLEHCAEMSLWVEGFRTVGDIREIMEEMHVSPKPQLMASYYEKLARIFWVSENYLFHAYSWQRFVSLSLTKNQALLEEDRRALATAAVLAALSIPIYASSTAGGVLGGGAGSQTLADPLSLDADRKKKHDLAQLLRTPLQPGGAGGSLAAGSAGSAAAPPPSVMPTRDALLAELAGASAGASASAAGLQQRRMLTFVRPEVAALFRLLEADFCPLQIVQRALPLLAWVQAQTSPTLPQVLQMQIVGGSSTSAAGVQTLAQYVPNLQRLLVFRLLEQLSQVYSTVMIPHFQGLIAGLNMSFFDVEKLAVRAVKTRMLAVRIDHRAGTMRLGSEAHETPAVRRKLATVASRLQRVVDNISPPPEEGSNVPQDRREQVFHYARVHTEAHRKEARRRAQLVQKRRSEAEQAAYKKNSEVRRASAKSCASCASTAPMPRTRFSRLAHAHARALASARQASCSSVPAFSHAGALPSERIALRYESAVV
jgi:translation initiation factor 3 subunit A